MLKICELAFFRVIQPVLDLRENWLDNGIMSGIYLETVLFADIQPNLIWEEFDVYDDSVSMALNN